MPIYKIDGKKDGLQRYNIRLNYISDYGQPKQMTRTAYGLEAAKDLERRLSNEIKTKAETAVKKMNVQQLYDEFIKNKQYEVRESTIAKYRYNFTYLILPTFNNVLIDKLTAASIQKWKILMEEKNLSFNTKKKASNDFQTALNYAVMMEYIPKNPLSKIGNFKDKLNIEQEMNIYTAHEFIKYIATAKTIAEEYQKTHQSFTEWDYYIFFNIAFYTGLRKGEILALKWSDINNEYLSVKRSTTQRKRHDR